MGLLINNAGITVRGETLLSDGSVVAYQWPAKRSKRGKYLGD
ncbi:hypothetical protein [Rhodanobacter sp. A1T4]|nr:hypothetical protein [Rhodanobacter sp. A1T4]MBB6247185.1 hypothetical protein [Rhodanobacter sp. A1T4]